MPQQKCGDYTALTPQMRFCSAQIWRHKQVLSAQVCLHKTTLFVCTSLTPQNNGVYIASAPPNILVCAALTPQQVVVCAVWITQKNRSAQLWLHKKAGLHSFDTTKEMPAQCWLHILLSALFWLQANCCMHSLDSTNNVFLPGCNSIRNVLSAQPTFDTTQKKCLHSFDFSSKFLSAQLWHHQKCLHSLTPQYASIVCTIVTPYFPCTALTPRTNLSAQLWLHKQKICAVVTSREWLHNFDSTYLVCTA